MAKSLRSKRMRRNRAAIALKTGPRVLKRMQDAMAKGKKFNEERAADKERVDAEKVAAEGVEMTEVTETVAEPVKDVDMNAANKPKFNIKSGINVDGSKPNWMSDKKYKKLSTRKTRTHNDKFGLVTEGLGPHRQFLRAKKKTWRKKRN